MQDAEKYNSLLEGLPKNLEDQTISFFQAESLLWFKCSQYAFKYLLPLLSFRMLFCMVTACIVLNICIRTRLAGLFCFVLPVASQLGFLHRWESIKSKIALFIFPFSSPLTGAKQWAAARTWYTAILIRPVFSAITSIIFIQGDWAAGRNAKDLTEYLCSGSLLWSFFQLEERLIICPISYME